MPKRFESRGPSQRQQRVAELVRHALAEVLQRGDIVFPKSSAPERMSENLDVFGFELTDEQMASVSALHHGTRSGPDPDTFDWRG